MPDYPDDPFVLIEQTVPKNELATSWILSFTLLVEIIRIF